MKCIDILAVSLFTGREKIYCLEIDTQYTVYAEELYNILIALQIIQTCKDSEKLLRNSIIFTDN